jgi:hypothetical protein
LQVAVFVSGHGAYLVRKALTTKDIKVHEGRPDFFAAGIMDSQVISELR